MNQVIDFFFTVLGFIWNTINQYWLLSMAFLITVIGWVVDLVRGSRQD